MNTINKVTIMACFLASMTSCVKELDITEVSGVKVTEITVTQAEDYQSSDKTVLSSNGSSILWNPGDEIKVFYGDSEVKFKSITKKPSKSSIFSCTESIMFIGGEDQSDYIWGVYPYSDQIEYQRDEYNDEWSYLYVPVSGFQVAVPESFDPENFPSVGCSHTTSMAFYNICGGVMFTLSQPGIKSIEFSAIGGESIAGTASIRTDSEYVYSDSQGYHYVRKPYCNWVSNGSSSIVLQPENGEEFQTNTNYYIAAIPTSLNSGFKMTFYKATSSGSRSSNKSVTISRSVFGNLGIADEGVVFEDSDGTEMVDLGLSVKWRSSNLGASSVTEKGDSYAWGEISTKDNYYDGNYRFSWPPTKYNGTDHKMILESEDDAAYQVLGDKWRIPTYREWQELSENCNLQYTVMFGVPGYKVTSRVAGYTDKWIFLPMTDEYEWWDGDGNKYVNKNAYYWSSTLYINDNNYRYAYVYYFYYQGINSTWHSYSDYWRSNNNYIRPVYGDLILPSSVELSKTSLAIPAGNTYKLSATVLPDNSSEKTIKWVSSDESVVRVSRDGAVTALKAGSATITVCSANNQVSASCAVTVKENQYPVPGYVDLGLSNLWATFNVGATKPEESGCYYAWGETETKSSFDTSNYKFYIDGNYRKLSKYNIFSAFGTIDNKKELEDCDDAAQLLGSVWHTPSPEDWLALRDSCQWTWTTVNGVSGYRISGKKSGYTDNSIFVPAVGYLSGTYLNDYSYFRYWTSSISETEPYDEWTSPYAIYYYAYSSYIGDASSSYRQYGRPIRPIMRRKDIPANSSHEGSFNVNDYNIDDTNSKDFFEE